MTTDTIVAIATAPGTGAIGILRLSGSDAFAIADALTPHSSPTQAQPGRTLRRAVLRDPDTGELLDDGLLAVFHAPKSFTGEDVVEFQGHGGRLVLQRTLAAFLRAGARAARPGEFSERAFINGKLDLAQAEAIADLISAGTIAAQRAARRQLHGELSAEVRRAADAIKEALTLIEASIDFPEEVGDLDGPGVAAALQTAGRLLENLVSTAAYGVRLRDGMTVVLTGRPNVGKSSLLNALAGSERAIVTPIPGTTRDVVEEALNLAGIPVRALDTAGIRETDDPVERIGVERAQAAVATADVVVGIVDATAGVTPEDITSLDALAGPRLVLVVNKADAADPAPMLTELAARYAPLPIYAVSATTRTGLVDLANAIADAATKNEASAGVAPLVTSARHENILYAAKDAIARADATLHLGLPAELIAVDAHAALHALGEITGETAREDILTGIFARFCLGK